MRFDLTSSDRPKAVAKRLRALLPGVAPSTAAAQAIVARMYGHDDWHALASSLGKRAESPDDRDCDAIVVERRRVHQVSVLTSAGVPEHEAARVVRELHATTVHRHATPQDLALRVLDILSAERGREILVDLDDRGLNGGYLVRHPGEEKRRKLVLMDEPFAKGLFDAFCGPDNFRATHVRFGDGEPSLRIQWIRGTSAYAGVTGTLILRGINLPIAETTASPPVSRTIARPPLAFPDLVDAYAATRRDAWFPVSYKGEASATGSRRYGLPWLPEGVAWPTDAEGFPARFVMQVNPLDLPSEARPLFGDDRLVSFFYDPDAPWGENGPQGDERATILRVDPTRPGGIRSAPPRARPSRADPVRFERGDDHPWLPAEAERDFAAVGMIDGTVLKGIRALKGAGPGVGDVARHGRKANPVAMARCAEDLAIAYGAPVDLADMGRWAAMRCHTGDKVGGWPRWEQGPDWQGRDGRRLALLLSIDAQAFDDEAAHTKAKVMTGRGQIFIDPDDPDHMRYVQAGD